MTKWSLFCLVFFSTKRRRDEIFFSSLGRGKNLFGCLIAENKRSGPVWCQSLLQSRNKLRVKPTTCHNRVAAEQRSAGLRWSVSPVFCLGGELLCFNRSCARSVFVLFIPPLCSRALQALMAQLLLRGAHTAVLFYLVSVWVTFLLWSLSESHWFAPQSNVKKEKAGLANAEPWQRVNECREELNQIKWVECSRYYLITKVKALWTLKSHLKKIKVFLIFMAFAYPIISIQSQKVHYWCWLS